MNGLQAIDELKKHGFCVRERQWNLGDTIFVGALPQTHSEITAYAVATYLYPGDGEAWRLTDIEGRGQDQVFPSLAEAVASATELMLSAIAQRCD